MGGVKDKKVHQKIKIEFNEKGNGRKREGLIKEQYRDK